MPVNLRSELRKALGANIVDLEKAVVCLAPSNRDITRLAYARRALSLVESDRSVFPEIERIAVELWQSHNGDTVNPMHLAPSTRKVMLCEAAVAYVIVHNLSNKKRIAA